MITVGSISDRSKYHDITDYITESITDYKNQWCAISVRINNKYYNTLIVTSEY